MQEHIGSLHTVTCPPCRKTDSNILLQLFEMSFYGNYLYSCFSQLAAVKYDRGFKPTVMPHLLQKALQPRVHLFQTKSSGCHTALFGSKRLTISSCFLFAVCFSTHVVHLYCLKCSMLLSSGQSSSPSAVSNSSCECAVVASGSR